MWKWNKAKKEEKNQPTSIKTEQRVSNYDKVKMLTCVSFDHYLVVLSDYSHLIWYLDYFRNVWRLSPKRKYF